MAEYIERDECRDNFYASVLSILSGDSTNDRANQIIDEFDTLPAADVEPVRRGKWLENEYRHYCSECGHMGLFNGFGFKLESNYCPHCGAKMEEYKSDIT